MSNSGQLLPFKLLKQESFFQFDPESFENRALPHMQAIIHIRELFERYANSQNDRSGRYNTCQVLVVKK